MTRSVEIPDEALLAATRALAEKFATNKPVNGSKDFTIDAHAALLAALPYLAPAGDGGLRQALVKAIEQKETEPDRRPRDKYGPIGRKSDPAIRVSLLREILAPHPAAPAVPQPALTLHESWHEAHPGYPCEYDTCPKGQVLDIPAAVPQPVDREALSAAVHEKSTAVVLEGGYITTLIAPEDAVAAVLAVLAGEQEQVEK